MGGMGGMEGMEGMEGMRQAAVASSESQFDGSTCIGATSGCCYSHAAYLDNDLLDPVGTGACLDQVQVHERSHVQVLYNHLRQSLSELPSSMIGYIIVNKRYMSRSRRECSALTGHIRGGTYPGMKVPTRASETPESAKSRTIYHMDTTQRTPPPLHALVSSFCWLWPFLTSLVVFSPPELGQNTVLSKQARRLGYFLSS